MANDGQIVFEVTADGRHAIADIKDITRAIQQETRRWDDAAEDATDNIEKNFSGMLKNLVAGFSAVKIGKALLDIGNQAISAASDLEEVQNVVDTTFGDGASKIEAWSKAAGSQFGLTETQAKRFTSTLGAMMKSSGMAGAEIVDMSTDLAGLAADMASFYNLDFDTAFQKIRSGISGETEPLKQLGINMSVANLNAYALQQGLGKTFEEMNQGEQTMLRYQYLMQATADAQGDFSRTSDGYANSVRMLQTNVDKLKTTLGKGFIDVVTQATGFLNSFLQKLMPDESKRTVLDDFADIDLKTDTKLEQIRQTAEEARLLTEQLDTIGGTKADKAGSKVQQIASGLAEIDLDQGKTGVVKDFISTLASNIDVLAAIQGTDAKGAKEWLEGIAESANKLDPDDAEGWTSLIASIKEGLPGIENTDFGSSFFGALGAGFADVEKKSSVLQWTIDALGNKTNKTAEEQALWLETCKRLVKTIPGLSNIINTETGEVKGGTQAVKEYVKAWEEGQTKLALLGALEQKESALSSRFSDLPGLQLDKALWEKRLRDRQSAMQALMQKYGITEYNSKMNKGSALATQLGLGDDAVDELNAAFSAMMEARGEVIKATDAYETQAQALEEAKQALKEYRETIDAMPGSVEKAATESEQFWIDNAENIKLVVTAANEAITALEDYANGVRESIMQSVESTTKGFEYIGNAAQRQAKRLEPLEKELADLDKNSKDYSKQLADINERTANAKDIYGIGNMTKNMQSQLSFLKEYKEDMEKARAKGFTNEFLSQFADGSVESAEWLHELANASDNQVEELNNLYGELTKGKEELTDTLAQQQLAADETYKTLAEKAKEAVAALDLGQQAADNAGKTIEGIATGIKDHVDSVAEQVDAIIAQLNRLDGFGINIDFGGFGSITWTTSTGKNADDSGRFGIDYVPRDDYLIRAHQGERLLTAQENQIWNALLNGGVAGFDLDALGGVMRDNIRPGGNVYLDGKIVGNVISDQQGRNYKSLQRSGWQQ